jgi:hypothetical protein
MIDLDFLVVVGTGTQRWYNVQQRNKDIKNI